MIQHPFHKTAWAMHRHLANSARSPFREARLLGRTTKGTTGDDAGQIVNEGMSALPDDRTPEEVWAGIKIENSGKKSQLVDVEKMQKMSTAEFEALIQQNPDKIKRAVLDKNPGRAKEVIEALDKNMIKDVARFHEHFIDLVRTNKAPKDDEKLQAIMKETREQTKEAEKADEPTFWNRLLTRMANDVHREFSSLYPPLARVLLTPSVHASLGKSPDAIFAALDEPKNRVSLMHELANLRYVLLDDTSLDASARAERLDDLFKCMEHTEEFLTPEDRIACAHLFAMVGAVRAHAHALNHAKKIGTEVTPEETDQRESEEKIQNLRSFFRSEKDQPKKIRGESGLRMKLEKEGRKDPAVALIAKGLEDEGWIDRLHTSEEFKYTCTIIALEELGILYNRIAHGPTTVHPESLMENVKRLIANAFRLGLRGYKRKDDSPFSEEDINPRKDFETLRTKIEQQMSAGEKLDSAELDELSLLGAIYGENEGEPMITNKEMDSYREQSELTQEELDRRAEEERRLLVSAVAESSSLRADVIERADLPTLQSAHAELVEEQKLIQQRAMIKKKKNRSEKEESRIHSEPGDAFRKTCDAEFAKRRMAILENTSITGEEKMRQVDTLEGEYDEELKLRTKLHETNIRSGWGRLLTALIGTEISRKAAALQEKYFGGMAPLLQKRARALQEKYGDVTEAPDYELIEPVEADTFVTLQKLRNTTIDSNSDTAYEQADLALRDLSFLETELEEPPEKNAERETENRQQAQRNAATILAHTDDDDLSPETREALSAQAAENSRPSHIAQKGLSMWASHLKIFNGAEKTESKKNLSPQSSLSESLMEQKASEIVEELNTLLTAFTENDAFAQAVRTRIQKEQNIIRHGTKGTAFNRTRSQQALERLEKLAETLRGANQEPLILPFVSLTGGESFQDFALANNLPTYSWGAYDRTRNRIVLNADKVGYYNARQAVLTEERKHVLHAALAEIYPLYLEEAFDSFLPNLPPELQQEFLALGNLWVPRGTLQESEWKSEVTDEYLAKRAIYQKYKEELSTTDSVPKHIPLNEREVRFFQSVDPFEHGMILNFVASEKGSRLSRKAAASGGAAHGGGGHGGGSGDDAVETLVEESKAPEHLEKIRQMFIKIEGFLESDPVHKTPSNIRMIEGLKDEYDRILIKWRKRGSESQEATRNRISKLHDEVERVVEVIKEYDMGTRDLTNEPEQFNLWFTICSDINWVTMSDIVAIVSAIKEDIARQYQRRQQARIGRVGESVTSWIQNVPVLRDFPYINALSSEFKRRETQSESEEVHKYKEAYSELDSYELQEMLHTPSSKDQMKAILMLLSERGRLDWNDTHFWEALNHLSRFKMPIKECQRNENLREDWLRKLISDIFGDKDQYRNLKIGNDSKIKSGKSDFTTEADRLSNLKGGLAGELEKQLYLFIQAHEKGKHMSDDVQPHLYEEIIEYSIRNGKMSMEEKFFYLVQGIAHGIIGRDRLGYLAGEGSGILNIFGFIDYFYGRNNTQSEIEALAKRLLETDDKSNPEYYRPGIKTTLWLELEVAREESVIQRVSKGMSQKGQDADHDDMHFFIPRLDAEVVASLTTPAGGGRPQLTPEAWENAYSGFNSYFKSFGILTKLEDEGEDKFTSHDALEVSRALATFIRMDCILTKRDTFGDTEGRRANLGWSRMKARGSVVIGNISVYEQRKKVDSFVKSMVKAYNLPQEYIDVMLYSTEEEGVLNSRKKSRAKELSDSFEIVMRNAIKEQGFTKMKSVLRQFEGSLLTHQADYNFENIRKKLPKSYH